jgi:cytochrome c peroxidase
MKARGPGAVGLETQEELLGSLLYSDKNLSLNRNQACSSCHELRPAIDAASGKPLPTPGFVDPDNVTNGTPVSVGSIRTLTGGLNTPSAGYAAFSPFFHWDANEGLYVGGQFWDGRAATLQAQAGGPFLNPVEMAMASKWAVIARLQENSNYLSLFKKVYDIQLDQIPGNEHELLNTTPPPGVFAAYDALTKAIAAFEKSRVFNRFTSKFDYYLAGKTQLTAQEQRGLVSFNGKAKCSACHISTPGIAPGGGVLPPLFTDFTYDNIGTPRNVNIPGNPAPGMGLGGRADIAARDPAGAEIGKHKVMSLRNIAVTAPYGHNGVFKTLEQTVHFYNTRDTLTRLADNNDPNFGITGWPSPEFSQNLNVVELGNLGLSAAEEADVVAFMRTLTDGYPEWGEDKNVPSGTPSPFAETLFPPFP